MSVTFFTALTISSSVLPDSSTSVLPSSTFATLSWISALISLAAVAERPARLRTSVATTAKPRPCSPARAASTAAFRASRLVWNAISSMTPMMSAIFLLASLMSPMARHRGAHHRAALLGLLARCHRELIGLAGVVGGLLDGRGHLLHRGGGLFQARGLLFGTLRQVGVALGNLLGAHLHLTGHALHFGHDASAMLPTSEFTPVPIDTYRPGLPFEVHRAGQVAIIGALHQVIELRHHVADAAPPGR